MEFCAVEKKTASLSASMKETEATGRKQHPRKVIASSSPPHLKNIWAVGQDGCTAKQHILPLCMWKYPGCAIPTANNILMHHRTWRMSKERFLCPAWPQLQEQDPHWRKSHQALSVGCWGVPLTAHGTHGLLFKSSTITTPSHWLLNHSSSKACPIWHENFELVYQRGIPIHCIRNNDPSQRAEKFGCNSIAYLMHVKIPKFIFLALQALNFLC